MRREDSGLARRAVEPPPAHLTEPTAQLHAKPLRSPDRQKHSREAWHFVASHRFRARAMKVNRVRPGNRCSPKRHSLNRHLSHCRSLSRMDRWILLRWLPVPHCLLPSGDWLESGSPHAVDRRVPERLLAERLSPLGRSSSCRLFASRSLPGCPIPAVPTPAFLIPSLSLPLRSPEGLVFLCPKPPRANVPS